MSEEALLVMKMVQEGKITPEQGVAFLEALKKQDAPDKSAGGPSGAGQSNDASWSTAAQAQKVLAQLQQQLAEMQAKIGAAQATGSSSGASVRGKLPFGFGDFNFTQIFDDAVKGVSALRNEAVVSAKRAARQAQREARRFRSEAERLGRNIHVEVHVRTDGRPSNTVGLPEATAREEITLDLSDDGLLAIGNPYGDVKVSGGSPDGQVHITADKTVWAGTSAERDQGLSGIKIEEVLRSDGKGFEVLVSVPNEFGAERVAVNLTVQAPSRARVEAVTTFGAIHCESIDGGVSRLESLAGDIRLLHVHDTGVPVEGGSRIATHSGTVAINQWKAGALTIESDSGEVQLDTIEAANLKVRASSGDVQARGIKAESGLSLEAMSGDVLVEEALTVGGGMVKTHSGDLTLRRISAGSLTVDTVSGDIMVVDTSGTTGRIVIKAISGDLQAKDLTAPDVTLNTTSGDVEAVMHAGFAGSVACGTVSGDVSLTLPPGYQARLTMTTHSGDLHCEFPLTEQEGDGERYLNGAIGPGAASSASAMLQSVSGDLRIKPASS